MCHDARTWVLFLSVLSRGATLGEKKLGNYNYSYEKESNGKDAC